MNSRWLVLAAVTLAACSGSTEPVATGPSLRFSGGASLSDTAGAELAQALIVEVRDSSGALAPAGTIVRFSSVERAMYWPELWIEPLTSTSYGTFATGTTDQAGRTGVLVKLGTVAGPARLLVSVPTLGLEDTARFTITAGKAARVKVTPADTALLMGKSFTLRGGVVDQWGNPRTDPVTWSSSAPGLTVTGAGLVTATALGRYYVKAAGTLGSDSGAVSVVPQGRLVAWSGRYGEFTLFTVDTDGSASTTVGTGIDGGIGAHPAWIPGTSTLVYTTVVGGFQGYQRLYTVGSDGQANPFFTTTPAGVTHQAEPTPTTDGKWLYFIAYDSRCSAYDYCVARAKIDGTGYELIVPTPSRNPAPSPDGSRVAYVSGSVIRVFDVGTGSTSSWSVPGSTPAWSPDGTQIAYVYGGQLYVMAPDGSGSRVITSTPYPGTSWVAGWSPDGKWLVTQTYSSAALINVATGVALPLGYLANKVVGGMK
jgi:Tol biopolymer transport system component